jgi:hypothetical protein
MSATCTSDTCKKSTITTITSPETKITIRDSVMMRVLIRGIHESRTWRMVLTPRNLEQRRRVIGLSM